MAITTKEGILKVLSAYNPWWKTGSVNPKLSKTYKRFAYYEAMKKLNDQAIRRIVVLTGTRRVGKTTIQYQMIEKLLQQGVAPQRIVFISMDHPMLKLSEFNEILECYHENIYADQDVYYFFDEIQYAHDWDKWLKIIYDMQPDTKVVATGSASPALVKGNQESGAGRWSVTQVPTMSFYEYCEILNLDRPELPENLKVTGLLHMTQLQHNLGSLLLCHVEQPRNLQIFRQLGTIQIQNFAIFIEGHCRDLRHRPSACTAFLIPFHQCRTCRTGRNHLGVWLHIINNLQPFIPVLGVLNLVKEIVYILSRVNIFMIAFQYFVEFTQLQHRMVHGNKYNTLRCHSLLQKFFYHLILNRCFTYPSCAC